MVASPLPDRERRHLLQFYVAPKVGYRSRMVLAAIPIVIGFGIQMVMPIDSVVLMLVLSIPILFLGNLLLLVRGYNLKPPNMSRNVEWEKTTRDRFQMMRQMENDVRRWDESFTDLTCASGVVALAVVIMILAGVTVVLMSQYDMRSWVPVLIADVLVLLVPHWITGTRRGWRPVALRQQIDALETALSLVDRYATPPCQIQPMFEMAGKKDQRVPIGARVFIRFPDGPEEFLGVQFQVTLNNVQGTNYPYLYAVIVAKRGFRLLTDYLPMVREELEARRTHQSTGLAALFKAKKQSRLTVTTSQESDVDVIVVRQTTTKQSGYHTDATAIQRITQAVWRGTSTILVHAVEAEPV